MGRLIVARRPVADWLPSFSASSKMKVLSWTNGMANRSPWWEAMHFPCAIAFALFVVVLSTFGCEQLKVRRFTMCKFYLFCSFSQMVVLSL